jgi:redox-sensitive bicupin YhaK (pirin superfamily)
MHKDGLGTEVEIKPGQVNWMTAGKGLAHSERTPERLRHSEKMMHGLQIWVALPKELEQMDPSFTHTEESELPSWVIDDVSYRLIAGEIDDKRSPVPVYSKLYFLEIKTEKKRSIQLGRSLYGEVGLYILKGSIATEGNTYAPKELLVAKNSSLCEFEMAEDTTVYIFGGEPFPEERFIYWNFVATSQELIEAAKQKWIAQEYAPVPGETDFIPLPVETTGVHIKS